MNIYNFFFSCKHAISFVVVVVVVADLDFVKKLLKIDTKIVGASLGDMLLY